MQRQAPVRAERWAWVRDKMGKKKLAEPIFG
jgi:hypothetical protein